MKPNTIRTAADVDAGRAPCPRGTSSRMPARPPAITVDDVGGYFQRDDGTVWRCIMFADKPDKTTATLELVSPPPLIEPAGASAQRLGGVVGAPIFAGFRRLVPEADEP